MSKKIETEWWEQRRLRFQEVWGVERIGDIDHELVWTYDNARERLFSSLKERFESRDLRLKAFPETPTPVQFLPIYLSLPEGLFPRLAAEKNDAQFRSLCRDNLPEVARPYIFTHGHTQSGGLNPSFVNTVFLEHSKFPINLLSSDQRVAVMQAFMGKLGSFKTLFVLCDRDRDKPIHSMMLSTLEGGHPSFGFGEVDELARRLRVFGSAMPADVQFVESDRKISDESWSGSSVVKNIQALGAFAGEHDLFSPGVRIGDLVRSDTLRRLIEGLVRYSQQAEGAIYAYDPDLEAAVVTASGRFGAIKTELQPADLLGAEISGNVLRRLAIDVSSQKGFSVEGGEFLKPQRQLGELYPLRVRRVGEGFVEDKNGAWVPPIRAILHIHRDVVEHEGIPFISQNVSENPPVGCGVDLMDTLSERGMRTALDLWKREGKRTPYVALQVANHGTNILIPWSSRKGVFPLRPFDQFMSDVEKGSVRFTREIRQV